MNKPYYEHDGITIYHGDCREIIQDFGNELIVTDPPYNIGYHYENYADKLAEDEYFDLLTVACRPPSIVIHYAEELHRLGYALGHFPEKIVAWVYPSNTARQWRGIAWWGCVPDFTLDGQEYKNPTDIRIIERIQRGERARLYDWWEINQIKNVGDEKTDHPCQIPLVIMKRILKITPPQPILDPFMGSGTTLRAAKDLRRKAIGIEIEEKYCEISVKRLEQEVFDFTP